MSFALNHKFWVATAEDLKDVLLQEQVIQKLQPTKNKQKAHKIYANLYSRYVTLVNNLGDIYDQTLQVQKRDLVRRLLESATKRLKELRKDLKKIELSEFIYIEQTIIEKKLIPHDVQLLRPFYFPRKRSPEIQEIIDNADDYVEKGSEISLQTTDEENKRKIKFHVAVEPIKVDKEKEKLVSALNLIKAHEKARQARIFFFNIKENPTIYKPKKERNSLSYEFTHRPDQPKLFKINRTKFSANYFMEKKNFDNVSYYVTPHHRKLKMDLAYDFVANQETLDIEDYFMEGLMDTEESFTFVKDQEPQYAEEYFLKGLEQPRSKKIRFVENFGENVSHKREDEKNLGIIYC